MLTSETATAVRPDSRPGYRPFRASVVRVVRLSPHFTRVTFTGPDLGSFGDHGLDQRINLIFPLDGVGLSDCGWDDEQPLADGYWYSRWRGLPNELRNPLRVYTVRAVRQAQRELDVDFVVHGDGPAARWLASAASGDELIVIGPDALSENSRLGIDWHPGEATTLLLVGDETAAPAIAGILSALPGDRAAHAIIEIPSSADALELDGHGDVTVQWVPRDGGHPGSTLLPAVQAWVAERPAVVGTSLANGSQQLEDAPELLWESPEADVHAGLYAWVAGESGAITSIRRYLVRDVGIDRGQVAFMGYWRRGTSQN
jgi:NADPH-dependent ferric siderophore reductase